MEEQIENEITHESEDDEDVVQGGWVTVTTNNVKVMTLFRISKIVTEPILFQESSNKGN